MSQTPVNKNASKAAADLLNYLCGIAGKSIITGQHTQTNQMEEIAYISDKTGKVPKLRGFELLAYSPNINYDGTSFECLGEIYANRGAVDTALKWGIFLISECLRSPIYRGHII